MFQEEIISQMKPEAVDKVKVRLPFQTEELQCKIFIVSNSD